MESEKSKPFPNFSLEEDECKDQKSPTLFRQELKTISIRRYSSLPVGEKNKIGEKLEFQE